MKIKYFRLKNGQYAGVIRRENQIIISFLVLSFIVCAIAWMFKPIVKVVSAETVQAVAEIKPCLPVCDLTEQSVKDKIYNQYKENGVNWFTPEDIKTLNIVDSFSKKYPIADRKVLETVITIAKKQEYTDYEKLFALINCESRFNPKATNSIGNKPSTSIDRGLWMWNSHWQKQVTKECAHDVTCSTQEAIKFIKDGKASLWTCNKLI